MIGNKREPILMCATGKKGVGKTFTTNLLIDTYTKGNRKARKKARKVLIYDINMNILNIKLLK